MRYFAIAAAIVPGGAGHFVIQIAQGMGAHVIATSSAKNRDFIVSLGANEHIDYRAQNFEDVLSDIDFVLDGIGGDVLEKSLKVARNGGRIVSLPTNEFPQPLLDEASRCDIGLEFVLVHSSGEDMNTLKRIFEANELKPHVSRVFSFEEMASAHRQLESGRTVDKIVVSL